MEDALGPVPQETDSEMEIFQAGSLLGSAIGNNYEAVMNVGWVIEES